jgi:hypothetical protein
MYWYRLAICSVSVVEATKNETAVDMNVPDGQEVAENAGVSSFGWREKQRRRRGACHKYR